jgi:cold shock CspA family protein
MHARTKVLRYVPESRYGFVDNGEGADIFFHMGTFDDGGWPNPPPIVGESVEFELDADSRSKVKAPKARRVRRVAKPVLKSGKVSSFSKESGWGFISSGDDPPYYLHRSEVRDGRLPIAGQRVKFYAGQCKGRPRACYIEIVG